MVTNISHKYDCRFVTKKYISKISTEKFQNLMNDQFRFADNIDVPL